MESYNVFLIGSFVALPAFKKQFGVFNTEINDHVIMPKWQSALQVSGQLGALIGVFVAGPLTSRIGYSWATITGLMLLNVFIFAFTLQSQCQLHSWLSYLKACHGVFSLPTRPLTAVRLYRSSSEPLLPRCCRCSGRLVVL